MEMTIRPPMYTNTNALKHDNLHKLQGHLNSHEDLWSVWTQEHAPVILFSPCPTGPIMCRTRFLP